MNKIAAQQSALLIDAGVFMFRSYHSVPLDFVDQSGRPVNAVHGFARWLCRLLKQTRATHIAIAFDENSESSFRNQIYPPYKANREPPPPDLARQFKLCRKLAQILGIATFSDNCYEADDLIGTLHNKYAKLGLDIYIISGDKDLAQLIRNNDQWWDFGKSEPLSYRQIQGKFGVTPEQIPDLLALAGDSVDNIPGVKGIGNKTAQILLQHFGDLDSIIDRHQEIGFLSFRGAKSCAKKIRTHHQDAFLSKQLSKIIIDIPLTNDTITKTPANGEQLIKFIEHMKFGPLMRRELIEAGKL